MAFVINLMLTQLLSPSRCKLVNVYLVFAAILGNVISDKFDGTLVHGGSIASRSCGAVFAAGVTVDVMLCILLFVDTPFISSFFRQMRLVTLIQIANLVLFFGTLSVARMAVLAGGVSFGAGAGTSLISTVVDNIVNVTVTFVKCNI